MKIFFFYENSSNLLIVFVFQLQLIICYYDNLNKYYMIFYFWIDQFLLSRKPARPFFFFVFVSVLFGGGAGNFKARRIDGWRNTTDWHSDITFEVAQ